ncbi:MULTISPECIES: carboxymuconolactone decarboxylase family protein [Paenibacillus]|uniref:carboxymuconolactone decarboxylase family protein n=1 Tax=Paenibacillus TaxID=44249 RepID=UPI0022B8680A|nr:carboxymuconolactone decarboxylase family protein [Paenibacillus caseinilyticus]MCZ8523557.1 carboxymuconolactone decarboxylase family protein [Paenibacillus caseinilyticus]
MTDDIIYRRSNLKRIADVQKLVPASAGAYFRFEKEAFASGAIPARTKELIAIAAAHVTGCPYCIDVHVGKFKNLGGTAEEVIEAAMVAGVVKAGAALAHSTHALRAFEELP